MFRDDGMLLSRIVLDSAGRNSRRFPDTANFELYAEELDLADVEEVRLVHISVPFPEPQIAAQRNSLYVRTSDGDTRCVLPRGTFSPEALAVEVTTALRRDLSSNAFWCRSTAAGTLNIVAGRQFSILTTGVEKTHPDGWKYEPPLPGSAATALGFVDGGEIFSLQVGYLWSVAAPNAPAPAGARTAVVRVDGMCGIRSDAPALDRALAVVHEGKSVDPVTIHAHKQSGRIKTIRVRILRTDGTPFDTAGRDVTVHLDVVRAKPYR